MTITVPTALAAMPDRDPTWAPWVASLPGTATGLLAEWGLVPDGASLHGECALVLPVRTDTGRAAVLKLAWPHDEARFEHLALQHWHGDGAVELLRADPHRWALLLERLHPRDLGTVDVSIACEVIGGLYGRLHRPAPPQLERLSARAACWAERLVALPRDAPVPRRLVDQAASLARTFAGDPATDGVLVHTDLHYANVLAGDREPWLAIDPKPLSGDPHVEITPLLWNRWDEVVAAWDVRAAIRVRLDTVVDVAGLDPDRARDWVVVRKMVDVLWRLEGLRDSGAALTETHRTLITQAVTITKAVLP